MDDALKHPQLVPPHDVHICFGGGDFVRVGQAIVSTMQHHANLREDAWVLDVGCGAGRIAFALAQVLGPKGRYEGFDLFPTGVVWCQERYAAPLPNFRFQLVDVFNAVYNPYSATRPRDFTFPYEDDTFDVAVLNSVFTHMLPEDVDQYMAELGRVLKPGGASCISWFLVADNERKQAGSPKSSPRLQHRFGSFFVENLESVEDAVGYDESFVMKLYQRHGFEVTANLRGRWRAGPGEKHLQDFIAARRSP